MGIPGDGDCLGMQVIGNVDCSTHTNIIPSSHHDALMPLIMHSLLLLIKSILADALYREIRCSQWQRTTCPLPSFRTARAVGGNEDKGLRLGCFTQSWLFIVAGRRGQTRLGAERS